MDSGFLTGVWTDGGGEGVWIDGGGDLEELFLVALYDSVMTVSSRSLDDDDFSEGKFSI